MQAKSMRELLTLIIFLTLLNSCATTDRIIKEDNNDKIVTNVVDRTEIVGNASFTNNNLSITLKPIDAQNFNNAISHLRLYDGSHYSVTSLINDASDDDESSRLKDLGTLTKMLEENGVSSSDIWEAVRIVDGSEVAENELYVFTDPTIKLETSASLKDENPFYNDGRYQTVVEIEVSNRGTESQQVCENEFIITSGNKNFKPIRSNELLDDYPASSKTYEFLHNSLINECEMIPGETTLVFHLVYPSFGKSGSFDLFWITTNSLQESAFEINNNIQINEYAFSRIRIEESGKGYRVIDNKNSISNSSSTISDNGSFHFVMLGSRLSFVESQDFFIHKDIQLDKVEILTIQEVDEGGYNVFTTPISNQNIEEGTIDISSNS